MIVPIRLGGDGQAALEGALAVKIVVRLDHEHIAVGLHHQVDHPPLPLLDGLDRLQGVVDDVAEQAVQIAVVHKGEPAPVRHAGKRNAVLLAVEALFREQDVQKLVARLHLGVVDGDAFLEVGHRLGPHLLPLGRQRAQLIADVVALDVDQVDGVPGYLVLPLALVDGVLEVFHLLLELPLLHRPGGEQQHDGAAHHREQVARLAQYKVRRDLEAVFPPRAQLGEIDVLHRAQDHRDAQHQHGDGEHLVVQPSAGYMPEQRADKRQIDRCRRQGKKAVVHQAVVDVEPPAPAVIPAQRFPAAPQRQIQLVAQVLGGVGHITAEQDGGEGLVKAQPHVGRGDSKQEDVNADPPRGRVPKGAVEDGRAIGQRQSRAAPGQHPRPESGRPVQLPRGQGVEHIQFKQKLQNDLLIDHVDLSHGFHLPPRRTSWSAPP